jgi:hypothetical protein
MLIKRLANSAVFWSWISNALRLASGLILLPVILRELTTEDLGMYYVFLSLVALVPIVDFGFGPTIGRFVSYAMGGAKSIAAQGAPSPGDSPGPNYLLLWELLATTRRLYRYLTLVILVVLGIWGTFNVELRVQETSSVLITRLAWMTTLLSTLFDIYSNWWVVFLRSMNEVRTAARIGVAAAAIKLALALALLLSGGGLLSLPIAVFFGSIFQRQFARSRCLALLPPSPALSGINLKRHLATVWPSSWRTGVQLLSGYLTLNANTTICLHLFGLAANAKYGLSVQVMGIASSMAYVWMMTKWPVIGQYRARQENVLIQRTFRTRLWLQNFSYLLLAGAAVSFGPQLLLWLLALMLGLFLDLQFTTWCTLILTSNRLPFLWPAVATNLLSLALSLSLAHLTSLGLGALVLGPLLAGSLFNYWYWPHHAARGIDSTLFYFLFLSPRPPGAAKTKG